MNRKVEDVHLIFLCKQHNAKAQMQLYDKYCDAMFKVAVRYVNDAYIAEDIMQESFLKAFTKISDFNTANTFGGWLKRIVINQALDWLKEKKLNQESFNESHFKIIEHKEKDMLIDINESVEAIYKAINKLPEQFKLVLKLFLLEGYDHNEISSILNITNVASRTILHRGKQKLLAQLKEKRYA
ncbi:MAG: sigma-70 family RNA polymerase sigma factor [Flavobacteriaceae bacterium]